MTGSTRLRGLRNTIARLLRARTTTDAPQRSAQRAQAADDRDASQLEIEIVSTDTQPLTPQQLADAAADKASAHEHFTAELDSGVRLGLLTDDDRAALLAYLRDTDTFVAAPQQQTEDVRARCAQIVERFRAKLDQLPPRYQYQAERSINSLAEGEPLRDGSVDAREVAADDHMMRTLVMRGHVEFTIGSLCNVYARWID